jgi:anti-sigma B factor antagonist
MEITTSQYKHCVVVKVTGRLDSFTSPKLMEELVKLNDQDRFKIVLDCSKLDFISSAGLRVLIATLKNCKRYNRGELVVAALPPTIQSVFELAGFQKIFKIYPDVLSAVGSF